MSADPHVVQSYLAHLGAPAAPPSLAALHDLVERHMLRIPFENIDLILGLRESLRFELWTMERFVEGLHRGRGGTCPMLTPHFAALLQHLGYDASLLFADFWSVHDTAPGPGNEHCVIQVRLDGRDYMIDVALRAPFLAPIPFDKSEPYRVATGPLEWVVDPRTPDGATKVQLIRKGVPVYGYVVHPGARTRDEFWENINPQLASLDHNFITNIDVVRCLGGTDWIGLRNKKLFVARNGKFMARDLPDLDAAERVLHDEMELPGLDLRGAVATIRELMKVEVF